MFALPDWIDYHASQGGERVAIIEPMRGERVSWRELRALSARMSRELEGIKPGARVALSMPNGAVMLAALAACASLELVAAPLNLRWSSSERDEALACLGASAWITEARHEARPVGVRVERLVADHEIDLGGDAALALFTSGSSGRPRAVLLTSANLEASIAQFTQGLKLHKSLTFAAVAPWFHVAGLCAMTLPLIKLGATIVAFERFEPSSLAAACERLGVDATFMVPTMWRALSQHEAFEAGAFDAFEVALTGGAPTPLDLLKAWSERGVELTIGYGMTEASPMVTLATGAQWRADATSVGDLGAGMQLELRDQDAYGVGRVAIRGPNVFAGYLDVRRDEPLDRGALDERGFFLTGDLGRLNGRGELCYMGRADEMISSGGELIAPLEVERALRVALGWGSVLVLGAPDPYWGEAVTVVAPGAQIERGAHTIESLRAALRGELAEYKLPRRLIAIEEMPLGASGKIDRAALFERLELGKLKEEADLSETTRWLEGDEAVIRCEELEQVARGELRIGIGLKLKARLEAGERLLDRLLRERAWVYGLTTGFGPLATTLVEPSEREALQRGLIAHLSSGVGELLDAESSRAILYARLLSLSRGHSCASRRLVAQIAALLNAGLAPTIPAYGTVGASGDLTPLAHAARGLLGEGELWIDGEQRESASEALSRCGLKRLKLTDREGLALVNGTSAMTALAALSQAKATRLFERALDLAVAYGEILGAQRGAWHRALGELRPHPGQQRVHEGLERRADSSSRLHAASARGAWRALPPSSGDEAVVRSSQPLIQDAYSLRCVPQLLGAIGDVMSWHREIVERELISVTDNPIFDVEQERVHHGGNFFGQHVAFASDALAAALIQMMVWLERVGARLCQGARGDGLPPFLIWRQDQAGLQSGFMGAQVSASALVALARTRASVSASTQSISTNAGNQDVVTMGTIAAMKVHELLPRLSELMAITTMMIAQAMEHKSEALRGYCASSLKLHELTRSVSPRLERDRALSEEIATLADLLGAI